MNAKSVMMTAAAMVAVFAAGVSAAKIKNVAVVEAVVDAQCGDDCKGIKKAEVSQITAELRRVARINLPPDIYNVMTKETILAQSEETLLECAAENCIIKMGEKIGAEYIVRSGLSKFGKRFTLTVEMYETKNGNLVAALPDNIRAQTVEDIFDKIGTVCAAMFKTFANEQAKKAPPPPPQYQQQANQQPPPAPAYQQHANQQPPPQPPAPAPPPQPQPQYQPQPAPPAPQPQYQPQPPPPPAPTAVNASTFTDGRDGKKYKTTVIGGQRWMAENLNYQTTSGSWCYKNDNSNCDKYGRLYDWNTAKTVCPKGWHLATRQDWDNLGQAVGGERKPEAKDRINWYGAGKKLKTRSGWKDNGNGTDDYGFSALPGGCRYRYSGGIFGNAGDYGDWWTASGKGGGSYYGRRIFYNYDNVYVNDFNKDDALSVRCVAD